MTLNIKTHDINVINAFHSSDTVLKVAVLQATVPRNGHMGDPRRQIHHHNMSILIVLIINMTTCQSTKLTDKVYTAPHII